MRSIRQAKATHSYYKLIVVVPSFFSSFLLFMSTDERKASFDRKTICFVYLFSIEIFAFQRGKTLPMTPEMNIFQLFYSFLTFIPKVTKIVSKTLQMARKFSIFHFSLKFTPKGMIKIVVLLIVNLCIVRLSISSHQ
jgi:hypothetical protein